MTKALANLIGNIKLVWGHLSSETVSQCHQQMKIFTANVSKSWIEQELGENHSKVLYRDAKEGFILKAHRISEGTYRHPHDHGSGWVIYAVYDGEMQMSTYINNQNANGEFELVKRNTQLMRNNDCAIYLPKDIHDTLCISKSSIVFRLTSCDFDKEFKEGRMTRYVNSTLS